MYRVSLQVVPREVREEQSLPREPGASLSRTNSDPLAIELLWGAPDPRVTEAPPPAGTPFTSRALPCSQVAASSRIAPQGIADSASAMSMDRATWRSRWTDPMENPASGARQEAGMAGGGLTGRLPRSAPGR